MSARTIPYYRPNVSADEIEAVSDCLRNGWLTTGPKVAEFENAFERASGARHAIALNSCTAGLHLALAALNVQAGDEVIMPSLTFAAGALCARHLGATPVFADIDADTLCVTAETIEAVTTDLTKVIMPMQYGGVPFDIDTLVLQAQNRGIHVIEDAAHAAGTLDLRGRWAGTVSDGASYSFYATKNITTAEGGMFVTNSDELADRVRLLSLHGMDRDAWKRYKLGSKYTYDIVANGYKYNMPDMAAALGLAQFAKLDIFQSKRELLAGRYLEAIRSTRGIRPVAQLPPLPSKHSWCVFAVLVEDDAGLTRDDLIHGLTERGIGTSVHFLPTHRMSAFRGVSRRSLPTTEWVSDHIVSLPLYPGMSTEDVDYVTASIKDIMDSKRKTLARTTIV